MASLTVGVALGCICGISLTLVAGKLLAARVGDLHAWHVGIYYTTFVAAVVWAMVRGAARASVDLLALATLSTAAIPVTSVIGALVPASGLWFSAGAGPLGVDVGAVLGALCFAWMWSRTRRRVEVGRTDSVWSARSRDGARKGEVGETVDEVVGTRQGG
jgi:hypothetical protein